MTPRPTSQRAFTWSWDKGFVLLIVTVAGALLWATPELITPYPAQIAWFESAAFFPKASLGLACLAGLWELYQRRVNIEIADSEELDSSGASMRQAIGMLLLFGLYMLAVPWMGYLSSTLVFLVAGSVWLGLGWRVTVALSIPLSLGMWLIFEKSLKIYFGHGWLV